MNSIIIANSFATASLYTEKYQIYDIKGGNLAGTSSGCPAGYTVSGELEDECVWVQALSRQHVLEV